MKRRLFTFALAALTVGLLGSCSKMNERIDGLDQRVGNIENEKIASIENQIADINSSIADLGTIRKDITDLQAAVGAKGEDISELKAADEALGKRIDTLKTYVETELPKYAEKDWVTATIATLEQLTATKADLLALQEKVDGPAISGAISNLDTRISALEARVSDLEEMIQSVTIVPAYTDGSVEAENGILTLKCIVSPAEALTGMESLKDSLLIYADSVKVKTKATTPAYMTIEVSEASVLDAAQGAITLTADISEYLPKGKDKALTVAVNIKNGISDFTTEFVPVYVAAPIEPTFDKVAAAKAALRTDGQAFDKVLKENGYSSTQFDKKYHKYIKGDDACLVLLAENIVTGINFFFVKDNFDAVKAEFASNEAACAKAYPDNFQASIESPNLNEDYNEESAFLRDGQSLTADIKEFACSAVSGGVGGADWRELLFSKEDGNQEWQCAIAVQCHQD